MSASAEFSSKCEPISKIFDIGCVDCFISLGIGRRPRRTQKGDDVVCRCHEFRWRISSAWIGYDDMKCRLAQIKLTLFLISTLLLAYLTYALQFGLSEFTLRHESGREEVVRLPILRGGMGQQIYVYTGFLEKRLLSPSVLRITPDNEIVSIKVNDATVDLTDYSREALGDFWKGVLIDFSDHLQLGSNKIEVVVADYGGDMGLSIRAGSTYPMWLAIGGWGLILLLLANEYWRQRSVPYLHRLLYVLIAVGIGLRVWTVFTYNPVGHIWSDAQRHWEHGVDTLRVDLMSQSDPILYQLYVGLLAKLSLKIPFLVAFYTSCLSVITPWIWYKFLRETHSNKALALAGWAIIGLLPSWISIYSYFMQETLLLPLLGGALWATWRARRKATVASFLLMVFIWMLAGLTRGIAIPLAAVACTYLWVFQDQKIKKACCSIMLLVFILGPLTYRSYHTIGVFAPHGLGHIVSLYALSGKKEILLKTERRGARWTHVFGSPSMGVQPFAPLSDWQTQRAGTFVVNVDFDYGKRDWEASYSNLSGSVFQNLWIIKENLIFLFFSPSWPDGNPERVLDNVNMAMRWMWLPLAIAVFGAAVLLRRHHKGQWLLPMLLLAWFVVQGLMPIAVNEGRYRKPIEGLLICQALMLVALRAGQGRSGLTGASVLGGFRIPFVSRTLVNREEKND